jgi:hypothetical protein
MAQPSVIITKEPQHNMLTPAVQRKRNEVARKAEAGLVRVALWVHVDDEQKLRQYCLKLTKARLKEVVHV